MTTIEKLVFKACADRHPVELALGFVRYEALRKVSPRQHAELHRRNLAGEHFNDLVDELIEQNNTPKP